MLSREFPQGVKVEQSSLSSLPRKCRISEQEKVQKVQLIQRQVKNWLLRRQQNDFEKATSFLNKSISESFDKSRSESDVKRAAITIQRTVRWWLTR